MKGNLCMYFWRCFFVKSILSRTKFYDRMKVDFTEFLRQNCNGGRQYSVTVTGILLSLFFGKNFVKVTSLLMKLLNSWFDEIFFSVKINFSATSTVWVWKRKITLTLFLQKKSVKSTHLLLNYIVRCFHEKFFSGCRKVVRVNCEYLTVW